MVNKKVRTAKKKQKQQQRLRRKQELASSLNFPFIQNDNLVRYIQTSKVMFIMRGLPGSGKSTIVESLIQKYKKSVVCSADDFFSTNGTYKFDVNLLKDAHEYCQNLAKNACENNTAVVIVDNTNVMRWEMKTYLEMAVMHNYVVVMVLPNTRWRFDAEELARRTKHGVTFEILKKKVKIFQDTIPLYYGWFLNERDSATLLEDGRKYLNLCLKVCPDLCRELLEAHGTDISNELVEPASLLQGYFTREGAARILHCTARFCRYGKEVGSKQYHSLDLVKSSCGKLFKLKITGITITPRTIAARVRLDSRQLKLWGNNEYERQIRRRFSHLVLKSVGKKASLDTSSVSQTDVTGKNLEVQVSNKRLSTMASAPEQLEANSEVPLWNLFTLLENSEKDNFPSITEEVDVSKGHNHDDHSSLFQDGVSAHMTLGYAKGIQAKQSGPDILDIIAVSAQKGPSFVKKFDDVVVHYFDDGRCEVCFNQSLEFYAIFSGFY